jgi:multiple sugar transport system ATP-binding protein
MTVERNLSFGLRVAGLPREEINKRVARAAEMLQLEPLLQRKPTALSGGQRQRVAIGRALVRDVDVFLFDEPLSNLDAKLRAELRVEIKRLHQKLGNTMIYVTHDQIEALTLADRVAVMKGGVIQQLDDPHVIYNEPKNLYVAGFIGSPTMNFIKGNIGGTAAAPSIAIGKGKVALKDYAAKGNLKTGQAVVFGVRPEHLRLNAGKESGLSDAFDATVDLIEPMGSDSLVWLKLAGQILSARVESSKIYKPNEKITVRFRVGLASLFDAESGERL